MFFDVAVYEHMAVLEVKISNGQERDVPAGSHCIVSHDSDILRELERVLMVSGSLILSGLTFRF